MQQTAYENVVKKTEMALYGAISLFVAIFYSRDTVVFLILLILYTLPSKSSCTLYPLIYEDEDVFEKENSNEETPAAQEVETQFRLYIGNLKHNTPEETLRTLLEEHGIEVGSISVKRSYAFVDCPDQANVDRAIDRLSGHQFSGSDKMQVEPSVGRRKRTNKIQIRNLPAYIAKDEIEAQVGPIMKFEHVGSEGLVYATFDNPDMAIQAAERLDGVDFNGSVIKADLVSKKGPPREQREPRGPPMRAGPGNPPSGPPPPNPQAPEIPLRIVVGSEFVGAIIGRSGQTIQQITDKCRARVDVHRSDAMMPPPETVISIRGSPDNCSNACIEIVKIIQSEAQTLMKGKGPQEQLGSNRECPLKVLCPNYLCGRIIGKQGSVIKAFMEQSGTHMAVSSQTDPLHFSDRVVTITGPMENLKKAESLLSEKIRKCNEQDKQNFGPMNMYGGGMPPNYYQGGRPPYPGPPGFPMQGPPGNYQEGPGGMYGGPPAQMVPVIETVHLFIPESTVGAVIGSKGSNIKAITNMAGAKVKIDNPDNQNGREQEREREPEQRREGQSGRFERKVIITGNPDSQFKAHFYIAEKIKTEMGVQGLNEINMRKEIMVPKAMVGRIIGKGGQHVKDLQKLLDARVKTPDTKSYPDSDKVPVSIEGNFYAIEAVQHSIRVLMDSSNTINGN